MKLKMILIGAAGALALGGVAHAGTVVFESTFEGVAGGPTTGTYTTVSSADGWTAGANGIELQNHVAGDPAAAGGNVFVELDTFANSSMSRTVAAGTYTLSYLYSPRPGISSASNIIDVSVNGALLGEQTGTGGSVTDWSAITSTFTVSAPATLTFAAGGASDSLGGYVDNITLTAVPEPATWGMMVLGAGLAGLALRTRQRRVLTA